MPFYEKSGNTHALYGVDGPALRREWLAAKDARRAELRRDAASRRPLTPDLPTIPPSSRLAILFLPAYDETAPIDPGRGPTAGWRYAHREALGRVYPEGQWDAIERTPLVPALHKVVEAMTGLPASSWIPYAMEWRDEATRAFNVARNTADLDALFPDVRDARENDTWGASARLDRPSD